MDRMKMQGLLGMMSNKGPQTDFDRLMMQKSSLNKGPQTDFDRLQEFRNNSMPQQRYTFDQMMQADPSGEYISNMFRDIPNLNEMQRRELFNSLDEEQRKQAFDILFNYAPQYSR
jgi:hypothetical protein